MRLAAPSKYQGVSRTAGGQGSSAPKSVRDANKKRFIKRKAKLVHQFATLPLKYRIYHIMDIEGLPNVEMNPFMTQVKALVYRLLSLLTIIMCICIVLATLPKYVAEENPAFDIIILISVLIFTLDWIIRMACSPSIVRSLTSILNIVDIVGLLPFWINFANVLPQGIVHWVLLLRILRLIRALMAFKQYHIVVKTIEESTEVAALLLMMLATALPTFGCAIYYAERGEYDESIGKWVRPCRLDFNCTKEVSPFQDAIEGMWFTATTVTTLGLGDVYPVSDVGYIIGGLAMIVAVFMIAFPIMILVVNFETEKNNVEKEKLRQQAKMGKFLQGLQKEHSRVNNEANILEAAQHRAAMSSLIDDDTIALANAVTGNSTFKTRTINFRIHAGDVYRPAMLFTEEEVRYKPLLTLMRDPLDPSLMSLVNTKKHPYRFKFKVALGTREAETAAKRAMNAILPTTHMKVTRARHFQVLDIHFHLIKPSHQCEFLRNVRLLKAYDDRISTDQTTVTGILELEDLRCTMDTQRIRDFGYALQRCRLRITASVVYHEPIDFEVPIFLDMLRATNLIKELSARPKGLTYCTREQIYELVNGIHHLLDLKDPQTDERYTIINVEQITVAVVNAIVSGYSMLLPDANDTKPHDFLFPAMREAAIAYAEDTNPNKKFVEYHGVFTNRLARRPEERSWMDVFLGKENVFDIPETDENSRDTKVLCHVNVKCVIPSLQTTTMSLECTAASPTPDTKRTLYDDGE